MTKTLTQDNFVRDVLSLLQRASSTTTTPLPGSVWITQKVILPMSEPGNTSSSTSQPSTLFRATGRGANGKDVRLSCSVPRAQGAAFQALLSQTLRSGCSALRKISKKEKNLKKKEVSTPLAIASTVTNGTGTRGK
jgi:hypothetical protein